MNNGWDYYHILGLGPTAHPDEIRSAYRRLARQHHPDAHPAEGDAAAHVTMSQINEAYDILSDPSRRAAYDQQFALRQVASAHGHSLHRAPAGRLSLASWSALIQVGILSVVLILGYWLYQWLQNIQLLRSDPPGEGLPIFLLSLMFITIMLGLLVQFKR